MYLCNVKSKLAHIGMRTTKKIWGKVAVFSHPKYAKNKQLKKRRPSQAETDTMWRDTLLVATLMDHWGLNWGDFLWGESTMDGRTWHHLTLAYAAWKNASFSLTFACEFVVAVSVYERLAHACLDTSQLSSFNSFIVRRVYNPTVALNSWFLWPVLCD